MVGQKKYLFILISQSHLQMRSATAPRTWSGILFTKIQLIPHIFLLSKLSLGKWHKLMNEEKGKNRELWLKTHNVATNS
jgi:hypothetical protein